MVTKYYISGNNDAGDSVRYSADTDTQDTAFTTFSDDLTQEVDTNVDGTLLYRAAGGATTGGAYVNFGKYDDTGSEQWRTNDIDGTNGEIEYYPAGPAVYAKTEASADDGTQSKFLKLNDSDGSTDITFSTGHGEASITSDATGVYFAYEDFASGNTIIEKYDHSGNLVWDEQDNAIEIPSIMANGSQFVATTSNGNVSRRNAETGVEDTLRSFPRSEPIEAADIDADGNILLGYTTSSFGSGAGNVIYQLADGTTEWDSDVSTSGDFDFSGPVTGLQFGESGVGYLSIYLSYAEFNLSDGSTNFDNSPFSSEFGTASVESIRVGREPLGDTGPVTEQISATPVASNASMGTPTATLIESISASPVSAEATVSSPSLLISQPATPTSASATISDGSVTSLTASASPVSATATMGTPDVLDIAIVSATPVSAQATVESPTIEFKLDVLSASPVSASGTVSSASVSRSEVGADSVLAQSVAQDATVTSYDVTAEPAEVEATMSQNVDVVATVDSNGTVVSAVAVPTETDSLAQFITESDVVPIESTVDSSDMRIYIGRGYGDVTNARKLGE